MARIKTEYEIKMQELVGDAYELCSDYEDMNSKVLLKHLSCGRTFTVNARQFLNGQRCPYCKRVLSTDQFKQTVEHLSDNRYQVIDFLPDYKATVRDTKNGRLLTLNRGVVLQELLRPTSSDVLPIDGDKHTDMPVFERATLISIFDDYGVGDIVFLDDISKEDKEFARRVLHDGKRAGHASHLAPGIYGRPWVEVTDEELLIKKYVDRNGRRIGYFFGETFLYELGLIDERPEIIQVVSNYTTRKHGRITTLNGIRLRIQSGRTVITNENADALPVLDILGRFRYYEKLCKMDLLKALVGHCICCGITKELIEDLTGFYSSHITNNVNRLVSEMEVLYE